VIVRDTILKVNLNTQVARMRVYTGKVVIEGRSKVSIRSTCNVFNATNCGKTDCSTGANMGSKGNCLMEDVCECDESRFASDTTGKLGLPLMNGTGTSPIGSYGDCLGFQEGKNGGKCKTGSVCDAGEGSCNGACCAVYKINVV
jgi:hypothetical protein